MDSLQGRVGGLSLSLVLLLAGGCASIKQVMPEATAPAAGPKPSVQLVLTDDVSAALTDMAEPATRDSGLFGQVSAAPKPATPADLTIKLGLKSQRRAVSNTETIWEATTIMLFTLYPSSCARDEYELAADVFDRSGRRLKSYNLRDSDTSMLWLFHGENCGDAPTVSKVRQVARGLLKTLYDRIGQDRLPAIANSGLPAGDGLPRVYVSTNRARDIVQRVALTAPPLAHFTFDEKDAPAADFKLALDLESSSSNWSQARGWAAMMSIGLVSPCTATSFSLKATLSDRSGKEIRTYKLSDTYSSEFNMGRGDCHPIDELSRPEAVAEFFGKLFAQLEHDRIFSSAAGHEISR